MSDRQCARFTHQACVCTYYLFDKPLYCLLGCRSLLCVLSWLSQCLFKVCPWLLFLYFCSFLTDVDVVLSLTPCKIQKKSHCHFFLFSCFSFRFISAFLCVSFPGGESLFHRKKCILLGTFLCLYLPLWLYNAPSIGTFVHTYIF